MTQTTEQALQTKYAELREQRDAMIERATYDLPSHQEIGELNELLDDLFARIVRLHANVGATSVSMPGVD